VAYGQFGSLRQNLYSGLRYYDKQNLITEHTTIFWKMEMFFSECELKHNIRWLLWLRANP